QDFGRAGHVIVMRLTVEENCGVFPAKAQLLHTRANLPGRRSEVRIDQDVPLRRDHEVTGKILAAHVVEAVCDPERGDRRSPRRLYVRADGRTAEDKE